MIADAQLSKQLLASSLKGNLDRYTNVYQLDIASMSASLALTLTSWPRHAFVVDEAR
jgi:hypothetical protein